MSLPTSELNLESLEGLKEYGFEGFLTVRTLRDEDCASVPAETGVYLVVRDWTEPPRFMPKSPAGFLRGQAPSVPVETLQEKWIEGACVLWIGHAHGPGVRHRLHQRIKRMIRFGSGKQVAHWGGRYLWQMSGANALRFAWFPTDKRESDKLFNRVFKAFDERYDALPFANLEIEEQESEE